MNKKLYPRIGIYPKHCHVFKKGCDGAYVKRRKIRSESGKTFIILDGQQVAVKRISDRNEMIHVAWETYYADR